MNRVVVAVMLAGACGRGASKSETEPNAATPATGTTESTTAPGVTAGTPSAAGTASSTTPTGLATATPGTGGPSSAATAPAMPVGALPAGAVLRLGDNVLRHGNEMVLLSWAPDGQRFITSDGTSLRIWSAARAFESELPVAKGDFITDVAWSPDGRWLAAGGRDVKVYDVAKRTVAWDLDLSGDEVRDLAFSPDSLSLAIASHNPACHHLGPPPSVGLWLRDVETSNPLREYAIAGGVNSVAFSPDGNLLVYADDQLQFVAAARTKPFAKVNLRASDVAFTRDGAALIASAAGSYVHIDVATRKVSKFAAPGGHAFSISPDGRLLVSAAEKGIAISDVATRKVLRTLVTTDVSKLVYAPDGQSVAVLFSNGQPRLLDPATATWRDGGGHASSIASIACTPDGRVMTTDKDGELRIWDATGAPRVLLPPSELVYAAWSADHKAVITATSDGVVRWRDPASGAEVKSTKVGKPLQDLALLPDGRIVSSTTKEMQVWRADGTVEKTIQAQGERDQFGEPSIDTLTASPDGKYLWTGGHRGHLWNTATWANPVTFGSEAGRAQFTPDSTKILLGDANSVRIFDIARPTEKPVENRANHGAPARAVSPDGKILAVASYHATSITEFPSGTKARLLADSGGKGTAVEFCGPDRVAVGYSTGQMLVWSVSAVMR